MTGGTDDRSPVAQAAAWATRIMTVSLELVVPGVLGHWIDSRLGTSPLLLLVGFALGGWLATMHLIRMVRK